MIFVIEKDTIYNQWVLWNVRRNVKIEVYKNKNKKNVKQVMKELLKDA